MNVTQTNPPVVSLDTACAITEISKNTWWRRIAKGDFTRAQDDARGRAMLFWSEVLPHICVPIAPDYLQIILEADAGHAEAQDDMGQIFLMAEKHKSAVYWFKQAAQQDHADAMQWLGHCHVGGKGVEQNDYLGLMWLAKAAALGHVIAQAQLKGLVSDGFQSERK